MRNVVLGTMLWGSDTSEDEAKDLFKICLDNGIRMFDTAPTYNGGQSEYILGRCMKMVPRDRVAVMTKWGYNDQRFTLSDSLYRLGTEYVNYYFHHRFGTCMARAGALMQMENARLDGKVMHVGVSNCSAWHIPRDVQINVQPMYSLVKRQAEVELLPMAQHYKMGVFPYSPLGSGTLCKFDGKRMDNERYRARYSGVCRESVGRFLETARVMGEDPASLALSWVGSHPAVTAPIVGARTADHLRSIIGSLDRKMTPSMRLEIGSLFEAPPPAHDRSEEAENA